MKSKPNPATRITAYHSAIQVWLSAVSEWSVEEVTTEQARSISRSLLSLRRTWRRKAAPLLEQGVKLIAVSLFLLAAGCTTVVTPQGEKCAYFIHSNWGIINNTAYNLDVFQDGVKICRIHPGQIVQLPPKFFGQPSLVSVSAYDKDGHYMGAANNTFSYSFNWQINRVSPANEMDYR